MQITIKARVTAKVDQTGTEAAPSRNTAKVTLNAPEQAMMKP